MSLKVLPLGYSVSNWQVAAPLNNSFCRKGGKYKERVFLTTSEATLSDGLYPDEMQYAIAGKFISKDEAIQELRKEFRTCGQQRNVVVVIGKTNSYGRPAHDYVLLNQASFAMRHGISLKTVRKVARESNALLLEKLLDRSESMIESETPFTELIKKSISEKARDQSIIKESFISILGHTFNDALESILDREIKISIPKLFNKKISEKFKSLVNNYKLNPKNYNFSREISQFMKNVGFSLPIPEFRAKSLDEGFRYREFHRAMGELFSFSNPLPSSGEIVLTGHILNDGKGDYVHMVTMAERLHQEFPGRKIRLFVISSETHRNKLPLLDPEICSTHITYCRDNHLAWKILKISELYEPSFVEKAKRCIQKADLWISGPISVNGLFNDLALEANRKGIAFCEYDGGTNWETLFQKKLRLGLEEEGIFTYHLKDRSWKELENSYLKTLFLARGT